MKFPLTVMLFSTIRFVLTDLNVPSAFKSADLTPSVVQKAPKGLIEIKYGQKNVELGNEFTLTETTRIPKIHYKYKCDAFYTLIMIDPDVPDLRHNREFVHWLVVNIPEDKIHKGQVLAEYAKPTPPIGSGLHRYTFLIYKQNQDAIRFNEKLLSAADRTSRKNFSIDKFTDKYGLDDLLYGNFFRAEAQ